MSSSDSSTHGNLKITNEIKPQILHNRMPYIYENQVLSNCTQGSPMMMQGEPNTQLLGHRFGYGYHHLYPYWGYGGYGYGYGYPFRGCYPYGCGRMWPWY